MDEQTKDILEIEVDRNDSKRIDETRMPEKILTIVAYIVLWIGVVGSIIFFFTCFTVIEEIDGNRMGFDFGKLVTSITTLLSSVLIWALMIVIRDISASLKEILRKIGANNEDEK